MGASRLDRLEKQIAINGALRFWQRVVGNTTTVNTATPQAGYTADRIKFGTSGGSTKNFSILRSTDVPLINGLVFPYSYQFNCLTALSPAAADLVVPFQYIIEGNDYRYLHARNMFLGFWIKITSPASFPLSVPVAFSNASTRCYITSFTVNASGAWQFIPIQTLLDSAGVWAFDSSAGFKITIASSAGTQFHGAQGFWQTGTNELFSFAGAANIMSHNTNVMRITGLQVYSLGNEANALAGFDGQEYPINSVADELRRCQRYFEKSYDLEVVPGTATSTGSWNYTGPVSTPRRISTPMKVTKRAAPVPTFYSTANANTTGVVTRDVSGDTAINFNLVSETQMGFEISSFPAGETRSYVHWTAESDF